jgi:hypothetical protein
MSKMDRLLIQRTCFAQDDSERDELDVSHRLYCNAATLALLNWDLGLPFASEQSRNTDIVVDD